MCIRDRVDRADDPDLAEKMKAEAEGIFLWAFEGLQRLVANNFKSVSYTHLAVYKRQIIIFCGANTPNPHFKKR